MKLQLPTCVWVKETKQYKPQALMDLLLFAESFVEKLTSVPHNTLCYSCPQDMKNWAKIFYLLPHAPLCQELKWCLRFLSSKMVSKANVSCSIRQACPLHLR